LEAWPGEFARLFNLYRHPKTPTRIAVDNMAVSGMLGGVFRKLKIGERKLI
jgi:hypothetical protein